MVVSVWSKDYDSVGGKKKFCLYMYNTQKKTTTKTLTPPTPVPTRVKKEEGYAFCM